MKRLFLTMLTVMAVGILRAQEAEEEGAAARSARETAARIMAIEDDAAAGGALAEAIRQIVGDVERESSGEAELLLAYILQTDSDRALRIIPTAFRALVGQIPLATFQRLVAAALAAAGEAGSALTKALLDALEGQSRWAAAVLSAARDIPGTLPPVLYQTLVQMSSVVLPPVVVPRPPAPPPPAPPYKGQ